jgi:DNA-binding protein H-NS
MGMPEIKMTERHLAALSIEELVELRDQIGATISKRVDSEKRILATKLARIEKYEIAMSKPGATRGKPSDPSATSRKVPPKYRDPSSGATWSGRGLRPRWLSAAMEAGAQPEDFRIVD